MFYVHLALAGVLGTFARYGLARTVQAAFGGAFPLGTLVVNVLGSFLFGLIFVLAEERAWFSPETRTALLVGFLGAFTTFSTFAFDTAGFVAGQQWGMAALNLVAQNALGLLGFFAGTWLARVL